jgi:inner membrane protein
MVVIAVAVLAVDQGVYQLVGGSTALQAPLDETAHLLTTLLILWSLIPRVHERVLIPALIASVAIDVDHIPHALGNQWLTAGTSRPYTHSLATIVVLLALVVASRRVTVPVLAVALGVASHLWRDLAEPVGAGVALLWPASDETCHLPAGLYLGGMAALGTIALMRAWRRSASAFRDDAR